MLLVQKIPNENSDAVITLAVTNRAFPSMAALQTHMRKHPEMYNADAEYTLMEVKQFLKVTRPSTVKILQLDVFDKAATEAL